MQLEQRVEGARGAEALGTGGRLCQMCWQQDCAGEGQHSSLAIQSLPLGTAVTTAAFFAYCSQERPVRFIFFWPNMQKSYITSLQAEGMPQKLWYLIASMLSCAHSSVLSELKWNENTNSLTESTPPHRKKKSQTNKQNPKQPTNQTPPYWKKREILSDPKKTPNHTKFRFRDTGKI